MTPSLKPSAITAHKLPLEPDLYFGSHRSNVVLTVQPLRCHWASIVLCWGNRVALQLIIQPLEGCDCVCFCFGKFVLDFSVFSLDNKQRQRSSEWVFLQMKLIKVEQHFFQSWHAHVKSVCGALNESKLQRFPASTRLHLHFDAAQKSVWTCQAFYIDMAPLRALRHLRNYAVEVQNRL